MAKEIDRVIGATLRNMRKRRGLTQGDVAKALHATQGLVSKIETGRRSLRVAEAAVYYTGVEMTFSQLYQELYDVLKDNGFA